MSPLRVKILKARSPDDLEKQVNAFIDQHHLSEYTIKSFDYNVANAGSMLLYSVMIVYYIGT